MEDAQASEGLSGHELREASFPQERRGYDREAVHAFLDRVADWVETKAGTSGAKQTITGEFAKVGERTAGILSAAEEAASKMRTEAKEYAQRLRATAEEEARKAKLNANNKAGELVAEAESKAEGIIEEAVVRRRRLNQAVSSLLQRRDEIADEAQRLADQLLDAVESLRSEEPIDEIDDDDFAEPEDEDAAESGDADDAERSRLIRAGFSPGSPRPGGEPTELEPPDQRQTSIHETDGPNEAPPQRFGGRP